MPVPHASCESSTTDDTRQLSLVQPKSRSRKLCNVSAPHFRRFQQRQKALGIGAKRVKKGTLYSKGTPEERAAWSLKLQMRKMEKKIKLNECGVLELLLSMQSQTRLSSGFKLRISRRGSLFTPKGLVNASCVKASHRGNRFVTSFSMTDFLEMSFGKLSAKKRIKQHNAQALAAEVSPSSLSTIQTTVACAIMARQARILANLFKLCKQCPPTVFALREAFDETGHHVTVNYGYGNEKTVSQICVIHHFMLLSWVNGMNDGIRKTLCLPLVLPPLLVVTPNAPQLHYATQNHPLLHTIKSLQKLIAATAEEQVFLQETDSASANDRLFHFKLNRFGGDRALRECIPCFNHQAVGVGD